MDKEKLMNKEILDYLIEKRNEYFIKVDDLYYESRITLIDEIIVNFTQNNKYSYAKKFINLFYRLYMFYYSHAKDKDLRLYYEAWIDLIYEIRNIFVNITES